MLLLLLLLLSVIVIVVVAVAVAVICQRCSLNFAFCWFPGSYGNGGVMRIAPVGLAYRNASVTDLMTAVKEAVICTHVRYGRSFVIDCIY